MTYTKGPWNRLTPTTSIVAEDGTGVATANNDNVDWPANARLIASAPELLEACKATVRRCTCRIEGKGDCQSCEQAKEAIQKAEAK